MLTRIDLYIYLNVIWLNWSTKWLCFDFFISRYFIGTNPSTFTFRITEERSIMGFDPKQTFNTLCSSGNANLLIEPASSCEGLTLWPVVYEPEYTLEPKTTTKDELWFSHRWVCKSEWLILLQWRRKEWFHKNSFQKFCIN